MVGSGTLKSFWIHNTAYRLLCLALLLPNGQERPIEPIWEEKIYLSVNPGVRKRITGLQSRTVEEPGLGFVYKTF